MTIYRDPVPENRTIINGIWSDLMDRFLAAMEISNRGNSGLGVYIQDQTTTPFSFPFLTGRVSFTLAIPTIINAYTISVQAGHSIVVGQHIEIYENGNLLKAEALIVAGNTITLDQPINNIYSTSATCENSSDSLIVDGSSTPVVFSVKPNAEQTGDVVRLIFELTSTEDMDFTTFGGRSELARGLVIRVNNGDGTYKNLINVKTNGEIIEQTFNHEFLLPKQGGTFKSFIANLTWGGTSNHGVVIRLDGSLNESLEIIVQDDLTADNTLFKMRVQGSEIQK